MPNTIKETEQLQTAKQAIVDIKDELYTKSHGKYVVKDIPILERIILFESMKTITKYIINEGV